MLAGRRSSGHGYHKNPYLRVIPDLEALEARIAAGVRAAPESRIGLALWLDSDGDAAHRAVATTLHR